MGNNLFLTEPVSSPAKFGAVDKAEAAANKKIEQAAKGFEGLFIKQLVDQINSPAEQFSSGDEEDNQSDQIRSMFSMFMSEHVANSGGIGFWKNIYQQVKEINSKSTGAEKVDSEV